MQQISAVFISQDGEFKLGDFSHAAILKLDTMMADGASYEYDLYVNEALLSAPQHRLLLAHVCEDHALAATQ
jgi:hypothetical protein